MASRSSCRRTRALVLVPPSWAAGSDSRTRDSDDASSSGIESIDRRARGELTHRRFRNGGSARPHGNRDRVGRRDSHTFRFRVEVSGGAYAARYLSRRAASGVAQPSASARRAMLQGAYFPHRVRQERLSSAAQ